MTDTITYTTTEISLTKLVPSPANARRTGATAGIDTLAASIAAHGLLQSLVVRPQRDSEGQATGRYEVVAGARRLAALKLLAKRKRVGKGIAIPCRVLGRNRGRIGGEPGRERGAPGHAPGRSVRCILQPPQRNGGALPGASPALVSACPGIADNPARQELLDAEDMWRGRLPSEHEALWGWLQDQDMPTLLGLLALCVARAADAGNRLWTTPEGKSCITAQVASATGLDMRTCWTPTKQNYLGRVSKALILDAVREGTAASVAHRIAGRKKEIMAQEAETLLQGTGWLPAMRDVPKPTYPVDSGDAPVSTQAVRAA